MAYRKWKETKLQPGTARPGNMLGCCFVSIYFLWTILCPQAVYSQDKRWPRKSHNNLYAIELPPYPRRQPCEEQCFRMCLGRRGRHPSQLLHCKQTRWSNRRPRPSDIRRGRLVPRSLSSWQALKSPGARFN